MGGKEEVIPPSQGQEDRATPESHKLIIILLLPLRFQFGDTEILQKLLLFNT